MFSFSGFGFGHVSFIGCVAGIVNRHSVIGFVFDDGRYPKDVSRYVTATDTQNETKFT